MKKLKSALFATLLLAVTNTIAAPSEVHTWHTVQTHQGTWHARLQFINQSGQFVTRDGSTINDFTISPGKSQDYGFIFDKGDNFDVAYTLTLTEDTNMMPLFSSKACVFVITASAPAKPDIRTSSFNGAKCDWKVVPGVGEDFFVSSL